MTKGKLTVIYGPMYAGKTTEVIKRYESDPEHTQIFKPIIDNRYSKHKVHSHTHKKADATVFNSDNPMSILVLIGENIKTIIIDEVQFCNASILWTVDEILSRGINVVCAGLNLDAEKRWFGQTMELARRADEEFLLLSYCTVCKKPAMYTQALFKKHEQTVVGGEQMYEARCEEHWIGLIE